MDHRLTAAKNHFPERSRAIEALAFRDDDFCTLCIDLADAEAAATHWKNETSPRGAQFHEEYLQLSKELSEEIEVFLNAESVVALKDRRPKATK